MEFKVTEYYKNNCEENYTTTPISVLAYISSLENERDEMLKALQNIVKEYDLDIVQGIDAKKIRELISKATTI